MATHQQWFCWLYATNTCAAGCSAPSVKGVHVNAPLYGCSTAARGVQPSLHTGAPQYPGNAAENTQELQAFPVTRNAGGLPPFDFHVPS